MGVHPCLPNTGNQIFIAIFRSGKQQDRPDTMSELEDSLDVKIELDKKDETLVLYSFSPYSISSPE